MAHGYLCLVILEIGIVGKVLECWMVLGTGLWKKAACGNTLITALVGIDDLLHGRDFGVPAFLMRAIRIVDVVPIHVKDCPFHDGIVVLPNFNTANKN